LRNLKLNSKIKNIRDLYRGVNDFKMDYQPRTNLVKDEKGGLIADSQHIDVEYIYGFVRWGGLQTKSMTS